MHYAVKVIGGLLGLAAMALAALPPPTDPIEGDWTTAANETVNVARCSSGWCGKLTSGPHAGRSVATFTGSEGGYAARIIEPVDGRIARATAAVEGDRLRIGGCPADAVCAGAGWKRL